MPSEAPPSSAEVTTSFTWRDSVDVKTFTNSGMMAPASVPQEMMVASFHHCDSSPPRIGMMSDETMYVRAMETAEVIHTREVSGDRKSTRLNSSHTVISYAVFCLTKKT